MKAPIHLIIRYSGGLAFFFLFFAILSGAYVCEGLWQGTGLQGYTIQPGSKGGWSFIVSTWNAFIQMLACLSLAALFGFIALRRPGGIRLGSSHIVIDPETSSEDLRTQKAWQGRRKPTKRRRQH